MNLRKKPSLLRIEETLMIKNNSAGEIKKIPRYRGI